MSEGVAPAATAQACQDIRRHLAAGAPWDACDTFLEARSHAPPDAALLFCGALAHARAAATEVAQALLDQALAAAGDAPTPLLTDILSLRGRLWKDRCQRAIGPDRRAEFARLAQQEYQRAFELSDDPFPGINAATLSMVLGDVEAAQSLARRLYQRLHADTLGLDMWRRATLAEALLLLGREAEAREHYEQAFALAGQDAGSVSSMRRQLSLLAPHWAPAQALMQALPAPRVLLLDQPDGVFTWMQPEQEAAWRAQCKALFAASGQAVACATPGCGAALVFVEEALAFGVEVTVLLPFDRQEFVEHCVRPGGPDWPARFERAMAQVARVVWATEEAYLGDKVLFQQGAAMLEGLARLRAAQLETQVNRISSPACASPPPHALAGSGAPANGHRTIKALLFGDVAGFSKLNDTHAPQFHARFLQVVANEIKACEHTPLETNTWGDALYVVFDRPVQAAEFALRLMRRMQQVNWSDVGLAPLSQIRLGLHAGPVYCGFDPIIGRDNYFGSSVTKTARIEPVTPPGMVYVSEAFAAQLAAQAQNAFTLEYMGELVLAKGYGKSRIYRLDEA